MAKQNELNMNWFSYSCYSCIALLLLCTFVITGCETKNAETRSTDITINGADINIYTIDSCEYVGRMYRTNSDILTHKGNCKYCTQRNKNKTDNE